MKQYIVRQNGYKDCGPSCLLSIMKYYGLEVSHEEVTMNLKTTREGTNAFNIINGSRLYGFDGFASHYNYDDIINSKVTLPIICHCKKDNFLHFIVIYKINKKSIIVMDPSSSITKITKEQFKDMYLNTSIVIYPVKQVCNSFSKNENIIKTYIWLNRKELFKILIINIFIILFGILLNYYSYIVIDYILPNYDYKKLIVFTIIFIISLIIKTIMLFINNKIVINLNNKLSKELNNDFIRKLFYLPYQFFKNKSSSEIISRMNDFKLFLDVLLNIITTTLSNILLVLISLTLLLIINYKLFFIYLIELILYAFIILLNKTKLRNLNEEVMIYEEKYNKSLNDNICSYEINKNLNLTNDIVNLTEMNFNIYHLKKTNSLNNQNKENILKEFVSDLSYISFVFLGCIFINKNIFTLGSFVLFQAIVIYFINPIKTILDLSESIDYLKNIYKRINDLLLIKDSKDRETNEIIDGNISIRNLSYSPNNIDFIFKNVSFDIVNRSKFLLYGSSGNGKSTIMKILLKYLKEYKGEIYIGDLNIKDINSNVISNSFTYVSQNNYIINDTLKNNIIYHRNISNEEYEKMINICNLNILRSRSILRDNYVIEDNGFNISGGEKQKILLARSLLKNSNYIILDEALSEVSFDEEKEILDKIFESYSDKTIIYVSHKKEIIDLFKKKYKLERS